jgi:hypothetical protein
METFHANEPKKRKREDADEISQTIAGEDHQEEVDSDADVDDDDDHEGGNNTNNKYNLASEDPPEHAAFGLEFEEVMTEFTGVIVEFERVLRRHASGSKPLQWMHMNAKALCERPKPTPPTFAVIGMRASGKCESNMPTSTWLFY